LTVNIPSGSLALDCYQCRGTEYECGAEALNENKLIQCRPAENICIQTKSGEQRN
jgi:hypothetical protein